MRRLLAILLAATSSAAGAQTTTPLSGEIRFDGAAAPVVNRAKCQGTGTIGLTWKAAEQTSGASFVSGKGTYSVYAKATDKTDTFPFCAAVSGTDPTLTTVANPTSLTVASPVQVSVSALVAAAVFDCTTANKPIYVCVLWTDDAPTPVVKAYAKGTVSLKVLAPGKPAVSGVGAGDGVLYVKATTPPDATTGEAAITWRAKAVALNAALDGETHYSATFGVTAGVGDEAKIDGLVNGAEYAVTAYSYSADDNESPPSDPKGPYVPVPSANAWEVYELSGGRETGGCQTGGAGLAALACAAVLLRLRRRS